jgi:hypothetical protein
VDHLAVDYLIGFAWQLTYNVQVKPQSSSASLGVTPEAWIHKYRPYRPYQTVDLKFSTKTLTLLEVF